MYRAACADCTVVCCPPCMHVLWAACLMFERMLLRFCCVSGRHICSLPSPRHGVVHCFAKRWNARLRMFLRGPASIMQQRHALRCVTPVHPLSHITGPTRGRGNDVPGSHLPLTLHRINVHVPCGHVSTSQHFFVAHSFRSRVMFCSERVTQPCFSTDPCPRAV